MKREIKIISDDPYGDEIDLKFGNMIGKNPFLRRWTKAGLKIYFCINHIKEHWKWYIGVLILPIILLIWSKYF